MYVYIFAYVIILTLYIALIINLTFLFLVNPFLTHLWTRVGVPASVFQTLASRGEKWMKWSEANLKSNALFKTNFPTQFMNVLYKNTCVSPQNILWNYHCKVLEWYLINIIVLNTWCFCDTPNMSWYHYDKTKQNKKT